MIKYFRSDSFFFGLTDFKALSARMSDTFSKVSRCLKVMQKAPIGAFCIPFTMH